MVPVVCVYLPLGDYVPLCVQSDEVEEILFCEKLKVIFLILNTQSMGRVSTSLGVAHNCSGMSYILVDLYAFCIF